MKDASGTPLALLAWNPATVMVYPLAFSVSGLGFLTVLWEIASCVILCRRDRSITHGLLIDRCICSLKRPRKRVVRFLKEWATLHHSLVDLDKAYKTRKKLHMPKM